MKLIRILIFLLIPSVCFALDETGALRLQYSTANRIHATAADKNLEAVSNLCSWVGVNATYLSCSDDGDGTVTLDFVGDYTDISALDAATDVVGSELETLTDGSDADALHYHDADNISISEIGTATYDDVQDFINQAWSSGLISGGALSVNGTSVDIAALTGFIADTDSANGRIIKSFDYAGATTTAISAGTTRYIFVDYNAGTPSYSLETTDDIHEYDKFLLGWVTNEGGTLHITQAPHLAANIPYKLEHALREIHGMTRADWLGGLILGESNDGNQYSTLSSGEIYYGLNEFDIAAVDTSGADTMTFYYHVAGTWTALAAQSTWPNTQYDDGTDLATLTVNRYTPLWFYVDVEDGELIMLYGQGNYVTQTTAEAEAPWSSPPERVASGAVLIGRYIIRKSNTTPELIQSSFDTAFNAAGVSDHGNLAGLSDDDHTQYTANADTDVSGTGWVLDEDAMGSDDDTKVPTQQSVKAYVDSQDHTTDEVGTLTSGDLCTNDGSQVQCTVNTEAELETALDALDVVTVTADDITSANLATLIDGESGTGNPLFGTNPAITTPTITGDIVFNERADHASTPGAGYGYLWTKNTTPSTIIFTDDAGTDTTLGSGGGGDITTDTEWDAKGDLIVADANDSADRLPVGTGGYILKVDLSEPEGLLWDAKIPSGATLPTSPSPITGDLFIHTPTGRKFLMQYDGTSWIGLYAYYTDGTSEIYIGAQGGADSLDNGTTGSPLLTLQYTVDLLPPTGQIDPSETVLIHLAKNNASADSWTNDTNGTNQAYADPVDIADHVGFKVKGTLIEEANATCDSRTHDGSYNFGTVTDTGAFGSYDNLLWYSVDDDEYRIIDSDTSDVLTLISNHSSTTATEYYIYDWGVTLGSTSIDGLGTNSMGTISDVHVMRIRDNQQGIELEDLKFLADNTNSYHGLFVINGSGADINRIMFQDAQVMVWHESKLTGGISNYDGDAWFNWQIMYASTSILKRIKVKTSVTAAKSAAAITSENSSFLWLWHGCMLDGGYIGTMARYGASINHVHSDGVQSARPMNRNQGGFAFGSYGQGGVFNYINAPSTTCQTNTDGVCSTGDAKPT